MNGRIICLFFLLHTATHLSIREGLVCSAARSGRGGCTTAIPIPQNHTNWGKEATTIPPTVHKFRCTQTCEVPSVVAVHRPFLPSRCDFFFFDFCYTAHRAPSQTSKQGKMTPPVLACLSRSVVLAGSLVRFVDDGSPRRPPIYRRAGAIWATCALLKSPGLTIPPGHSNSSPQ